MSSKRVPKIAKRVYFTEETAALIEKQARRLDRDHSWITEQAVKLGMKELDALPDAPR